MNCTSCQAPVEGIICEYCGTQNGLVSTTAQELEGVEALRKAMSRVGSEASTGGGLLASLSNKLDSRSAAQVALLESMWIPHDPIAASRLGMYLLSLAGNSALNMSGLSGQGRFMVGKAAMERLGAVIDQLEIEHPDHASTIQISAAYRKKRIRRMVPMLAFIGGIVLFVVVTFGWLANLPDARGTATTSAVQDATGAVVQTEAPAELYGLYTSSSDASIRLTITPTGMSSADGCGGNVQWTSFEESSAGSWRFRVSPPGEQGDEGEGFLVNGGSITKLPDGTLLISLQTGPRGLDCYADALSGAFHRPEG